MQKIGIVCCHLIIYYEATHLIITSHSNTGIQSTSPRLKMAISVQYIAVEGMYDTLDNIVCILQTLDLEPNLLSFAFPQCY